MTRTEAERRAATIVPKGFFAEVRALLSYSLEDACEDKLRQDIADTLADTGEAEGWRPISDEAKAANDDILLGCTWSTFRIVAFWDDTPEKPGFPWQSPDGAAYPEGAFDRWMPLPSPPTSGEG